MTVNLTINGAPRTKKNSPRVVRAGKFTKVIPSKAYCDWAKSAEWELKPQMTVRGGFPLTEKVNCRALFYRDVDIGDADGFYAGLADILQSSGVLVNDRQIVSWDGSRLLKDARHPRVEVTLEAVEAAGGK